MSEVDRCTFLVMVAILHNPISDTRRYAVEVRKDLRSISVAYVIGSCHGNFADSKCITWFDEDPYASGETDQFFHVTSLSRYIQLDSPCLRGVGSLRVL